MACTPNIIARHLAPFLLTLLVTGWQGYAQSVQIVAIDTTGYPTMRASFMAFDTMGRPARPLVGDLALLDDGVVRTIRQVAYPDSGPAKALSSVLLFDVTATPASDASGRTNLELAKAGATAWVRALPYDRSECAIVAYHDAAYSVQDFTSDQQNLLRGIGGIQRRLGVQRLDQALAGSPHGALRISRNGKNRRVIVLATDGYSVVSNRQQLIDMAAEQQCAIHVVAFGIHVPEEYRDIVLRTGGSVTDNVRTEAQAEQAFLTILRNEQYAPGLIEWYSAASCAAPDRSLTLSWGDAQHTVSYQTPDRAVRRLVVEPAIVRFEDPVVGTAVSKDIVVTALHGDVDVRNIRLSDPSYAITPTAFTLKAGERQTLTLRYTANDSGYTMCLVNVDVEDCPQTLYVSAGRSRVKPANPGLRLLRPRDGDVLQAGSDAVFTWEGVTPADTVRLDYSTNDGATWHTLAERATGLSYTWSPVPSVAGDSCRFRVAQGIIPTGYDPSKRDPQVLWQRCYGGSSFDHARTVTEARDGTYVVAAYTSSNDGDVTGAKGKQDMWILRLHPDTGDIIWQRTLGGSQDDLQSFSDAYCQSVIETRDGAFVVVGTTMSRDGDVIGNTPLGSNTWVVKLHPDDGSVLWQTILGGSNTDESGSIVEADDGDLVLAGFTASVETDSQFDGMHVPDAWLVKLDASNGSMVWQRALGGTMKDEASAIYKTSTGNILVAGETASTNGDLAGLGVQYPRDMWMFEIDPDDGAIVWQRVFNIEGPPTEKAYSVFEDSDGAYVMTGMGPRARTANDRNAFLLRLDHRTDSVLWSKLYGGSGNEWFSQGFETADQRYAVVGATSSNDGDVTGVKGSSDGWFATIQPSDGSILSQVLIGGSENDNLVSVAATQDASFVAVGCSFSSDADIPMQQGAGDVWVVKLGESIILQSDTSNGRVTIVHAALTARDVDLGSCAVGAVRDTVVADIVRNETSYDCGVMEVAFLGADSAAFALNSGVPPVIVPSNTMHAAAISFTPRRSGPHQANMRIRTLSDTLWQTVSGVGVAPALRAEPAEVDLGLSIVGQTRNISHIATIINESGRPIAIDSIRTGWPAANDMTVMSTDQPAVLQPGDRRVFGIRYTPADLGSMSSRLLVYHDGPGSPTVIHLFGRGVADTIRTTVMVNPIQAAVGQPVNLILSIAASDNLDVPMAPTEFTATIGIPSSVVHITDPAFPCTPIDSATCLVRVSGSRSDGGTLVTIPAMATLGTTDDAPLQVVDFAWQNTPHVTEVTRIDGTIRITDVCNEGGPRLFIPSGSRYSLACMPNPVETTAEIHYGVAEAGPVTIDVIDRTGRIVVTPVSDRLVQPGSYLRHVNVRQLSAGPYMVVLRGANVVLYTRMDVAR